MSPQQPQTPTKKETSPKVYIKLINKSDKGWFYCPKDECIRTYTTEQLIEKDEARKISWVRGDKDDTIIFPLCPDHNIKMSYHADAGINSLVQ